MIWIMPTFLFVCTLLEFSGKLSTVSYCTALKNSIQLAFHWKLTKKWLSGQFWQRLEQSSSLHQLKVAIEERPYFRSTAFFLSIMFDCSNSLLPVFFQQLQEEDEDKSFIVLKCHNDTPHRFRSSMAGQLSCQMRLPLTSNCLDDIFFRVWGSNWKNLTSRKKTVKWGIVLLHKSKTKLTF